MAAMTSAERFVACVNGEPIDRVPFGLGLGWFPWSTAMDRWRSETGDPSLDLTKEFGFDPYFICPPVRQGFYPLFEEIILEETPKYVVKRTCHGVTRREHKDIVGMPEFLSYPVTAREDWEALKRERLRPDDPGRTAIDWNAFRAEAAATGSPVFVGDFPHGVFGTARELLGAEELLISFYTQPEVVRDIMEHMTTVWLSVWKRVAAEIHIDYLIIWEDMSGRQGSLLSPKMVRGFMMPCYDRIAAFARNAGVRVLAVDTDGDCSELVPVFVERGVNLVYPFEVQAGNDVRDYRRAYPKLAIMGGLDKRALARDRSAIDKELAKAREMVKLGRYIPGFDHFVPDDVPWANYKYAVERLKDICYGG